MAAGSSMPTYLQKPQVSLVSSYLNKTSSISTINHYNDPVMKPLFPRRLSIKATSSSTTSDPVIVKKLNADNSSSSKTSGPWLMLTPEMNSSSGIFKFYSLAEDKFITIEQKKNLKGQLGLGSKKADLEVKGSSHGWLALFDTYSGDLFLYNPLSNRHLKLPSIRKLQGIQEDDLELGDCVSKVIISSSDPEEDLNCRALMIYGENDYLAFCCPCPNSSSNEWTETYHCYVDVVCGDNDNLLFFGVNDNDSAWPYPEFEAWDLKDVWQPRLISLEDRLVKDYGETFPWKGYDSSMDREANFLVASHGGQLYYVCLHCGDECDGGDWDLTKIHFHVHKFDFEKGKLVHMDRSLDGLAFFVGRNHSFALSVSEFPELKPNSIYFTHPDDSYDWSDLPLGSKHMNVYNYEDGTFSPPYYTLKSSKGTPPMWYAPNCTTIV